MEIKHLVHYYYYDYITIIVFSSSALLTDGKKKQTVAHSPEHTITALQWTKKTKKKRREKNPDY